MSLLSSIALALAKSPSLSVVVFNKTRGDEFSMNFRNSRTTVRESVLTDVGKYPAKLLLAGC
jgi:hypothetical protein